MNRRQNDHDGSHIIFMRERGVEEEKIGWVACLFPCLFVYLFGGLFKVSVLDVVVLEGILEEVASLVEER